MCFATGSVLTAAAAAAEAAAAAAAEQTFSSPIENFHLGERHLLVTESDVVLIILVVCRATLLYENAAYFIQGQIMHSFSLPYH